MSKGSQGRLVHIIARSGDVEQLPVKCNINNPFLLIDGILRHNKGAR